MDRRKRAGVPSVQKLEQIECFASANLAQQDAVRPVAKACLEQIPDAHCGQVVLGAASFEVHEIRSADLDFGGVFDNKHTLLVSNEISEDVEQGGLAGAGPARYQDILTFADGCSQAIGKVVGQRADAD